MVTDCIKAVGDLVWGAVTAFVSSWNVLSVSSQAFTAWLSIAAVSYVLLGLWNLIFYVIK